jgi:selenide,water dikinase
VLRELPPSVSQALLVGFDTADDAGVYRLNETTALVQTVDFFTPIVDDPRWFGAIAAANSLSDVYAMGGEPITALNILCYPIRERPAEELHAILEAGAEKTREAGVALLGGHSVEDAEPKFGMAVTGLVHPEHIATNAGARPGDVIVLTKPLGTGIITTAAKFDECPAEVLEVACRSMAMLNRGAAAAMRMVGIGAELPVHAATDITGYGLLGHLFQMAKASRVGMELESSVLPLLPEVEHLAAAGNVTRGEHENRAYLGAHLEVAEGVAATRLSVMLDPQTSGGLAIVVAPEGVDALLEALRANGVANPVVIGRCVQDVASRIRVLG